MRADQDEKLGLCRATLEKTNENDMFLPGTGAGVQPLSCQWGGLCSAQQSNATQRPWGLELPNSCCFPLYHVAICFILEEQLCSNLWDLESLLLGCLFRPFRSFLSKLGKAESRESVLTRALWFSESHKTVVLFNLLLSAVESQRVSQKSLSLPCTNILSTSKTLRSRIGLISSTIHVQFFRLKGGAQPHIIIDQDPDSLILTPFKRCSQCSSGSNNCQHRYNKCALCKLTVRVP